MTVIVGTGTNPPDGGIGIPESTTGALTDIGETVWLLHSVAVSRTVDSADTVVITVVRTSVVTVGPGTVTVGPATGVGTYWTVGTGYGEGVAEYSVRVAVTVAVDVVWTMTVGVTVGSAVTVTVMTGLGVAVSPGGNGVGVVSPNMTAVAIMNLTTNSPFG
ncbi:hypothetical protein GCM10010412_041070 [Nonomuraea recticatena]|uniref:Uncharacterized protein n=1 Tax=Nonomuraea recticatena TaxID=46178 RepID=A0ABN3S3G1_9ACTN